ncbi:MAG: ROK family glucokinase [Clostridiales bacterium]|nr:ROK family glucokinase [Clostridiales bacterium]
MDKYCFGIDIGGTTIKCGLFTEQGDCIDKWEIATRKQNNGEQISQDVADTIANKIKERDLSKEDIVGVGIGVPGPITEDGRVLKCANLGWGIFNVNEKMSSLTGLKVASGNDANVAALGEMWMGGGKGYEDVIMVTLGTGVGGGVILNGKIVAGSNGGGGEIGHIIINPDETDVCGCGGHGHLEQYASATGIVRMAKKRLEKSEEETTLRELKDISAKDIFDHAKAGDKVANELVEDLGRYLGIALSHVAAAVDPQVFVIGGGVSRAGKILIDVIEKYYNQNILYALSNKEFRLAELGNDAGIYGCAKMILG